MFAVTVKLNIISKVTNKITMRQMSSFSYKLIYLFTSEFPDNFDKLGDILRWNKSRFTVVHMKIIQ